MQGSDKQPQQAQPQEAEPQEAESQETDSQQPIYRRKAYEQRGRAAPIDGIVRVSAPREWLVLILLAVMVAAVIAWSVLGRLESGVTAACVLRPAGAPHAAVASVSAVVAETLAVPGERVSVGDPLVRLAAPEISLAAELAQARSTALTAQSPGSVEALAAAAEAEALQSAETAATLVLSPTNGVMGPQFTSAGTVVSAGSTVAEVFDNIDAVPQATLVVASSESARIRPAMSVSVNITAAEQTDAIRVTGLISDTRSATELAGNEVFRLANLAPVGGSGISGGSGVVVVVDLEDDTPAGVSALAAQSQAAYACEAHIVTESRRPIRLLIGRD